MYIVERKVCQYTEIHFCQRWFQPKFFTLLVFIDSTPNPF